MNVEKGKKGFQSRPALVRFWEKVEKTDGCWLWRGANRGAGYGAFIFDGSQDMAHRAAYKLLVGPITNGLHVLHSCDNRRCVRPDHLHLGTHQENMAEASSRKRFARAKGEANPAAKLRNADVEEIRRAYAAKEASQRALATRFGVSQRAVWGVVNCLNWRPR